jgi:hypothetical protein
MAAAELERADVGKWGEGPKGPRRVCAQVRYARTGAQEARRAAKNDSPRN